MFSYESYRIQQIPEANDELENQLNISLLAFVE